MPGPRQLKILYSPLHGVGQSAVCPVLAAAGFKRRRGFRAARPARRRFSQRPQPRGQSRECGRVRGHHRQRPADGAELILATDPDCDRLGCAAPDFDAARRGVGDVSGNQIGSLLTDYLLAARKAAGTLSPASYVVKTLVTTELIRQIADDYGVQTAGNLLVGFKYIGGEIDRRGPQDFIFGAEESYGFLAGDHARDKDAAVASMLLSELAARLKAQGQTLHQRLDELFLRYGCHSESQFSLQMPGEKGMEDMKCPDGRPAQQPAEGHRRHEGRPRTRLSARHVAGGRQRTQPWATRRPGDLRPRAGRQLRSGPPLGH